MDIRNLANCANPDSVFNVGKPLCDLKKKKMKGVILMDAGVVFTGADIASVAAFIAAVKSKTTAPRGGRVYPIWDVTNFEDNTGDPATGGVGNLSTATIVTSDAIPAFRFGYDGSEARHKRIAAMAGASLEVMFVDDQFAVYGTDKANGIGGFSVLQAYADTSKFIVADAVNQYSFRLTLGSINEYRDQSSYVVTNAGILAAVGLINVEMKEVSHASNVYQVAVIADGGTNMEELHGAALAGLTFTARNLETGAAIPVTSVSRNAALHALTMTLDTTAFGAMAVGDRFEISGPDSSALAAAGVKPFEIITSTFVKTA